MSDFRIGIIAEGKTDIIVIKEILKQAFIDINYRVTVLSPTEDELLGNVNKHEGFGWRSVYEVCRELTDCLQILGIGNKFDIIIVHLDADVAQSSYDAANINTKRKDLPCYDYTASIAENCEKLETVAKGWLDVRYWDSIVFCIPHIATDIWPAYVLYDNSNGLFYEAMPGNDLEQKMLRCGNKSVGKLVKRKEGRIKKIPATYSAAMTRIDSGMWEKLKSNFSQFDKFNRDLNGFIV